MWNSADRVKTRDLLRRQCDLRCGQVACKAAQRTWSDSGRHAFVRDLGDRNSAKCGARVVNNCEHGKKLQFAELTCSMRRD
jgi:hypothetical protein